MFSFLVILLQWYCTQDNLRLHYLIFKIISYLELLNYILLFTSVIILRWRIYITSKIILKITISKNSSYQVNLRYGSPTWLVICYIFYQTYFFHYIPHYYFLSITFYLIWNYLEEVFYLICKVGYSRTQSNWFFLSCIYLSRFCVTIPLHTLLYIIINFWLPLYFPVII